MEHNLAIEEQTTNSVWGRTFEMGKEQKFLHFFKSLYVFFLKPKSKGLRFGFFVDTWESLCSNILVFPKPLQADAEHVVRGKVVIPI